VLIYVFSGGSRHPPGEGFPSKTAFATNKERVTHKKIEKVG
jgi:hypothetical protein